MLSYFILKGGANGLRDLSINSHENITKEYGNINENENNDNSFEEDCERNDDPYDDNGDNDENVMKTMAIMMKM